MTPTNAPEARSFVRRDSGDASSDYSNCRPPAGVRFYLAPVAVLVILVVLGCEKTDLPSRSGKPALASRSVIDANARLNTTCFMAPRQGLGPSQINARRQDIETLIGAFRAAGRGGSIG
jgi:hypothetical protein